MNKYIFNLMVTLINILMIFRGKTLDIVLLNLLNVPFDKICSQKNIKIH